ncbi:MAG TPA: cytochrome c maturation protein CcmE [Polyangiaceae bacterium]|jgi:cytochrome c-type biogenesis protein CcmE|nr:cytochrome c maturation protein CcmE [Polyangiaceae bacterium]
MSHLDDELAQAVRESEAVAEAQPAPVAVPVAGPARKPQRSIGLLVALLVAGGAILTLVFTSFKGSMVYARNVDQLLNEKQKLLGRNVTLQGTLKRGTLTKRDEPCEYRFTIKGDATELPVRYPGCVLPDTFKDVPGMPTEVTAQGTLDPAGFFAANTIVAKCPSKYQMKDLAAKGQKPPHEMTGPTSAL